MPSGWGLVISGSLIMVFAILTAANSNGRVSQFDIIELLILVLCGAVYISAGRIVQAINANTQAVIGSMVRSRNETLAKMDQMSEQPKDTP